MCWVGGLQRGCVAKAAFSFSWEQKEYYSTIIFPMGQNMSKVSLTGEVAPSYSKMFSKRTLELIVDSLWPLLHVTNREGDRFSMSSSRVHRKNWKWP